MVRERTDRPRGILHRDGTRERFAARRYHPDPSLAERIDTFWVTRWHLDASAPHRQEILPHPCIHVVVERGHSGVFGIEKGRFVKDLDGIGRAFGIKFRPGAFLRRPAASIESSGTPLHDVFGRAGEVYERAALDRADDRQLVRLAETFVAAHCPPLDDPARLACRIAEDMATNSELMRVEEVARRHGLSVRSLQRLFERRVGVAPKWVLQRYRIHEAVERLETGDTVDFASLAAALGYFDQAHFVGDFSRLVGRSPGAYVASLSKPGT